MLKQGWGRDYFVRGVWDKVWLMARLRPFALPILSLYNGFSLEVRREGTRGKSSSGASGWVAVYLRTI